MSRVKSKKYFGCDFSVACGSAQKEALSLGRSKYLNVLLWVFFIAALVASGEMGAPLQASLASAVSGQQSGGAASGQNAQNSELPALVEVNRSVLSIGSDVYTSFDAVLLLQFWNLLTPTPVSFITNWDTTTGFVFRRELDLLTNIKSWPTDATRLLFLGLVWSEAKRLNLFVPAEKEMEVALTRVKKEGVTSSREELAAYFKGMPESRLREYLEIVLRARTFEKVRGGFEKNPGLLNASWFWHVQPLSSAKKNTK